MLYMNVSIFKWICTSIGIKPETVYGTGSATFEAVTIFVSIVF
jgi:hypothetical protein